MPGWKWTNEPAALLNHTDWFIAERMSGDLKNIYVYKIWPSFRLISASMDFLLGGSCISTAWHPTTTVALRRSRWVKQKERLRRTWIWWDVRNDSTDFGKSDQQNFEFRLVKYCAIIKTKHSNMCGHDWLHVFSNSWLHDVTTGPYWTGLIGFILALIACFLCWCDGQSHRDWVPQCLAHLLWAALEQRNAQFDHEIPEFETTTSINGCFRK